MASERVQKLLDALTASAPRAALVVLVLIVGLILSSLAGRLVAWLTRKTGFEAFAEKVGIAKPLYAIGARDGIAKLLGRLASFAGLLLTLSAVADLLDLEAVAAVTSLVVRFLPRLLAAVGVLLGGLAVAALVRNVVRAVGGAREDVEAPDFVAQLAYYVIVTVAVTLAADQAGLQTGIVESLILVVVGISLAAVGLSFALGARAVFGHLTARLYYQKVVRPGDTLRVGDREGVVVGFSPIAVILRVERGVTLVVPCSQLMEEAVSVRTAAPTDPPPAKTPKSP